MRETFTIVAETKHYLVVDKPSGLPTVPLKGQTEQDTLLSRVAEEYPEIMGFGKNGWEGGVLHRLDNQTRGLVLIARDEETYRILKQEQEAGLITKEYLATSSIRRDPSIGFPPFPYEDITSGNVVTIGSLFRPFGEKRREVRPVSGDCPSSWKAKSSGQWYLTKVRQIEVRGTTRSFICSLTSGFRHQVRVHLAWAGHPLDGDLNYRGDRTKPFGLTAVSLLFNDPETGERVGWKHESKAIDE